MALGPSTRSLWEAGPRWMRMDADGAELGSLQNSSRVVLDVGICLMFNEVERSIGG